MGVECGSLGRKFEKDAAPEKPKDKHGTAPAPGDFQRNFMSKFRLRAAGNGGGGGAYFLCLCTQRSL